MRRWGLIGVVNVNVSTYSACVCNPYTNGTAKRYGIDEGTIPQHPVRSIDVTRVEVSWDGLANEVRAANRPRPKQEQEGRVRKKRAYHVKDVLDDNLLG